MSGQSLSSRAIVGAYFLRLEQSLGQSWINLVGTPFPSNQESETYKWLGMSPVMREWIGGRHAKGFRDNGITILNKHYEATLEVLTSELRRDKTGQILVRVNEMADRTAAHWAKLLSTLILNGESTVCYDAQFFFDTDHSEGDSGTQSNDLAITLSTLPVAAGPDKGPGDDPSPEQMKHCIMRAVRQIYGFVDDQGEPMNELARQFLVMVPTRLWGAAQAAVVLSNLTQGETNIIPALAGQGVRFGVAANPRLDSTWGLAGSPEQGQFAVFRTDGNVKPFILQEETGVQMKVIGDGSELEFNEDKHHYGVDTWRNVGYGYWQQACLVTMT